MSGEEREGANALKRLKSKNKHKKQPSIPFKLSSPFQRRLRWRKTNNDNMHSTFQGSSTPSYLSTWKAAASKRQNHIAIKRVAWFYGEYNYKVFERNVEIKRMGFT